MPAVLNIFRVGLDYWSSKNLIFADPLTYHTLIQPVNFVVITENWNICDIGWCELTEQFITTDFVQSFSADKVIHYDIWSIGVCPFFAEQNLILCDTSVIVHIHLLIIVL